LARRLENSAEKQRAPGGGGKRNTWGGVVQDHRGGVFTKIEKPRSLESGFVSREREHQGGGAGQRDRCRAKGEGDSKKDTAREEKLTTKDDADREALMKRRQAAMYDPKSMTYDDRVGTKDHLERGGLGNRMGPISGKKRRL